MNQGTDETSGEELIMASSKKATTKSRDLVRALRKQNAALKSQLRKAQEDSEAYRKAYQALAIKQITPARLREWDQEVEDSGQTILDVIREFKGSRGTNGRT